MDIIQHEILVKLPSKPLLRCHEPEFVSTHIKKCQNNQEETRLLVLEPPDLGYYEQICSIRSSKNFRRMSGLDIELFWHGHYQAVGYINGLLCLKTYRSKTQPYKILLWNPSIKKALQLPRFQITSAVEVRFDVDCAFGYDVVKNDYKVVVSLYIGSGYQIPSFVHIFTLSTFSWKHAEVGYGTHCLWIKNGPKVFLDGVVYWAGNDVTKVIKKGRYTHFVSFDVASEEFKNIDLPDCEEGNLWDHERFPIVLDQTLGLMENFETFTHIWIRDKGKDKVESWKRIYVIRLQLLHKCLLFKPDGEFLFAGETGGVKSYNIKSQETKVLAKSYKISLILLASTRRVWPY
ncbi:F-box protein CPR1 [Bienertia sinuspersici]